MKLWLHTLRVELNKLNHLGDLKWLLVPIT